MKPARLEKADAVPTGAVRDRLDAREVYRSALKIADETAAQLDRERYVADLGQEVRLLGRKASRLLQDRLGPLFHLGFR